MKRIVSIVIVLCICLSLSSCIITPPDEYPIEKRDIARAIRDPVSDKIVGLTYNNNNYMLDSTGATINGEKILIAWYGSIFRINFYFPGEYFAAREDDPTIIHYWIGYCIKEDHNPIEDIYTINQTNVQIPLLKYVDFEQKEEDDTYYAASQYPFEYELLIRSFTLVSATRHDIKYVFDIVKIDGEWFVYQKGNYIAPLLDEGVKLLKDNNIID